MQESQIIDWLNENELRAYPLEDIGRTASSGYHLPDGILLDALFVTSDATVSLDLIEADSTNVAFTISSIANPIVVPRASTFPYYYRDTDGNLLVIGEAMADIPNGSYAFFAQAYFESSVIFDPTGWEGVTSISVHPVFANVLPLSGSGTTTVLTGDIELVDGYQLSVNVPEVESLQLSAGRMDGWPIDCSRFRTASDDSCDTIVSTVNGVAPSAQHQLQLVGGQNVLVLDDPDNHRIFIGLRFNEGDVCTPVTIPQFSALLDAP